MATTGVRITGLTEVQAKLAMSEEGILAFNRMMVGAMLAEVKKIVIAETPTGPGHFGYHLKDTYETDVRSRGLRTIGVLKAPPQGYWREYGTYGRARIHTSKSHKVTHFTAKEAKMILSNSSGRGAGGEAAGMYAHKALTGLRKFINYYYGGMANWWRL